MRHKPRLSSVKRRPYSDIPPPRSQPAQHATALPGNKMRPLRSRTDSSTIIWEQNAPSVFPNGLFHHEVGAQAAAGHGYSTKNIIFVIFRLAVAFI